MEVRPALSTDLGMAVQAAASLASGLPSDPLTSSTSSVAAHAVSPIVAAGTSQTSPGARTSARHQHTLSAPHLTDGYDTGIVPDVPPISSPYGAIGLTSMAAPGCDKSDEADAMSDFSQDGGQVSPAGHGIAHRRHLSLGSHPYASSRASSTASVASASEDWASESGQDLVASPPGSPTGKSSSFAAIGTLDDLRDGPDGPNGRPGYAYVTLIRYAILGSPRQKLTLGELYEAIEKRYPFYKTAGKGWKNSVRHNLSLNRCFKAKGSKAYFVSRDSRSSPSSSHSGTHRDPGKGSYWRVDLDEEISTSRIRNRKKAVKETPTPAPYSQPVHGMLYPQGDLWAQQPRMGYVPPAPFYPSQQAFSSWRPPTQFGMAPPPQQTAPPQSMPMDYSSSVPASQSQAGGQTWLADGPSNPFAAFGYPTQGLTPFPFLYDANTAALLAMQQNSFGFAGMPPRQQQGMAQAMAAQQAYRAVEMGGERTPTQPRHPTSTEPTASSGA